MDPEHLLKHLREAEKRAEHLNRLEAERGYWRNRVADSVKPEVLFAVLHEKDKGQYPYFKAPSWIRSSRYHKLRQSWETLWDDVPSGLVRDELISLANLVYYRSCRWPEWSWKRCLDYSREVLATLLADDDFWPKYWASKHWMEFRDELKDVKYGERREPQSNDPERVIPLDELSKRAYNHPAMQGLKRGLRDKALHLLCHPEDELEPTRRRLTRAEKQLRTTALVEVKEKNFNARVRKAVSRAKSAERTRALKHVRRKAEARQERERSRDRKRNPKHRPVDAGETGDEGEMHISIPWPKQQSSARVRRAQEERREGQTKRTAHGHGHTIWLGDEPELPPPARPRLRRRAGDDFRDLAAREAVRHDVALEEGDHVEDLLAVADLIEELHEERVAREVQEAERAVEAEVKMAEAEEEQVERFTRGARAFGDTATAREVARAAANAMVEDDGAGVGPFDDGEEEKNPDPPMDPAPPVAQTPVDTRSDHWWWAPLVGTTLPSMVAAMREFRQPDAAWNRVWVRQIERIAGLALVFSGPLELSQMVGVAIMFVQGSLPNNSSIVLELLSDYLDDWDVKSPALEGQTRTFEEAMRDVSGKMTRVREVMGLPDSPLVTKTTHFFKCLAALPALHKIGLEAPLSAVSAMMDSWRPEVRVEAHPYFSFIAAMVDLTKFVSTRGYEFLMTGDLALLASASEVALWAKRANAALTASHNLVPEYDEYTPNIGERMSYRQFVDEAKLLVEMVPRLASLHSKHSGYLWSTELKLKQAVLEAQLQASAIGLRLTPFAVLAVSEPGVGKSGLANSLVRAFEVRLQTMAGKPPICDDTYTLRATAGEEFMSGLRPGTRHIIMDELAARSAAINQADPSLQMILQAVSNIPYFPAMPKAEDKGKIAVNAYSFVGMTNNKGLNALQQCADPAAIMRRFLFITPTVKPEFALGDGLAIDVEKAAVPGAEPHVFRVERCIVLGGRQWKFTEPTLFNTTSELLTWVSDEFEKHVRNQRLFISLVNNADKRSCMICGGSMTPIERHVVCARTHPEIWERTLAAHQMGPVAQALTIHDFLSRNPDEVARIKMEVGALTWYQALKYELGMRMMRHEYWHAAMVVPRYVPTLGNLVLGGAIEFVSVSRSLVQSEISVGHWWQLCLLCLAAPIRFWRDPVTDGTALSIRNVRVSIRVVMVAAWAALGAAVLGGLWYFLRRQPPPEGQTQPSVAREEETPHLMQAKHGKVVTIQPVVTAPTHRWQSVTPCHGFVVPPSEYDDRFRSASLSDLTHVVSQRTFPILVVYRTGREKVGDKSDGQVGACFAVGPNRVCTALHNFTRFAHAMEGMYEVTIIRRFKIDGKPFAGSNLRFSVHPANIEVQNGDVALFDFAGPPLPHLGDWMIPTPEQADGCSGVVAVPFLSDEFRKGGVDSHPFKNARRARNVRYRVEGEWFALPVALEYGIASEKGMSGSPVVVQTTLAGGRPGDSYVYGVHCCGDPGLKGWASPVKVERESVSLSVEPVGQGRPWPGTAMLLAPISDRSFLNNFCDGNFIPLGSVSKHRARYGQMVFPTLISDKLDPERYPNLWTHPTMAGRMVDGEWINPIEVGLGPVFELEVPSSGLWEAFTARTYLEWVRLKAGAGRLQGRGFRMLSIHEAINGRVGQMYVDPLNFRSSGGFGFEGEKGKYFSGPPGNRVMGEKLRLEYERIVRNLVAGRRSYPVFTASLKQEPIKVEKNVKGKVRVFGASPLGFNIPFRQLFQPVISFIMLNRFELGIGVGINCLSREWGLLSEKLTQWGDNRIIGGDFSQYDKRMGAPAIWEAFQVLIKFAEEYGDYNAQQLNMMRLMAAETTWHVLCANGDMIQMVNSNPSGQSATVIINSIVNIMYLFYCCCDMTRSPQGNAHYLSEVLWFMVYGDDNVLTSKEDRINHTFLAEKMKEIGQVYTMAEKGAESQPYIGLAEATFLKRGFRFDADTGQVACPLVEESIAKMLHWVVESRIGARAQTAAVLQDAHEQYFMYGQSVFEERSAYLQGIAAQVGLEADVTWHTFEQVKERLLQGSLKISATSCGLDAESSSASRETEVGGGNGVLQGADSAKRRSGSSPEGQGIQIFCLADGTVVRADHRASLRFSNTSSNQGGGVVPPEISAASDGAEDHQQQTLQLEESVAVEKVDVGLSIPTNAVLSGADRAYLASFLERPIKAISDTWTTNAGTMWSINPWQVFLFNPGVLNKIQNFQYVRGKLHARLVVNGSPFHYGLVAMTYYPFKDDTSVCVSLDVNRAFQLPHAMLNPSGGASVEIALPFVNQRDFINLSMVGATGEYARRTGLNMGRLELTELVPLRMANAAGATTVEYSLFLWMTEVELQLPTPYPVIAQSDEYSGEGVISKPASVLAGWASWFKDVPVIGKFARATEIGANAVSGIASIFGFSRPLQLADVHHFRPRYFGPMANTSGKDLSLKLTQDPKNEVTIDPTVLGLPPVDSMAFANIISREGVIAFFDWNGNQASGTTLARIPVSPAVIDIEQSGVTAGAFRFRYTPVAFVSQAFTQWTGSLKYRIQFVASQYHRGRVRVTYFPQRAAILPSVDYTNLAHNHIIDLTETRDYTFTVGWAQANPWGSCAPLVGSWATPTGYDMTANTGNGMIVVDVINQLRAPLDPSDVRIIITVSAGDDLKFAIPTTESSSWGRVFDGTFVRNDFPSDEFNFNVNTYTRSGPEPVAQSDSVPVTVVAPAPQVLVPSLSTAQTKLALHMGEDVASLRALFKRFQPFIRFQSTVANFSFEYGGYVQTLPSFIFDAFSQQNIVQTKNTLTLAYQIPLNFITLFQPCFACARGGLRYKVVMNTVVVDGSAQNKPAVQTPQRPLVANIVNEVWKFPLACTTSTLPDGANIDAVQAENTGVERFDGGVQPGVDFEVPYYYPLNFRMAGAFTPDPSATVGGAINGGDPLYRNVQVKCAWATPSAGASRTHGTTYVAAAEDYTLDWFLCTPYMYLSAVPPTRTILQT